MMQITSSLPRNLHYLVLQGNYGPRGWEDISIELIRDFNKIIEMQNDMIHLRREYAQFEKYKYRILHRRCINPVWNNFWNKNYG